MNGNMIGFPFVELPLFESVSPKEDIYPEEEDSFVRTLLENSIIHKEIEPEIEDLDSLD